MEPQRSRRRAIVLVLDACGIGALPDAAEYGDAGADTLAHVAEAVGGLRVPTLGALGLGSIAPLAGVAPVPAPLIHGRLRTLGPGKDSITGHWELMGVVLERPLPTFPHGFPATLVNELERLSGRAMICNRPDNGIAAIEEFGEEHLRTGALILYTSADSVLQLAAHVERCPPQELYGTCAAVRAAMRGEHGVGRVIARPFDGRPGCFTRTDGRRDYALEPPSRSYLQELGDGGVAVHGVGKIADLFAGIGVEHAHPGADNEAALDSLQELLRDLPAGLVFVNLIETDQVYGHRKDSAGFAGALERVDARLRELAPLLRDDDLLVVTADHGVDPARAGTDHTREYAPLLAGSGAAVRVAIATAEGALGAPGRAVAPGASARRDGVLADVGASVLAYLSGRASPLPGEAFIS